MSPFELGHVDIVCPPDADEHQWQAARKRGIGGSDVAQAIGLSPWGSPYLLWQEKTGARQPVFTDRQRVRMESGHSLEPQIRREFERTHPELVVTTTPGTIAVRDAPWQRVNVDGLVWTRDGELDGVFEAKSCGRDNAEEWAGDEVPISYVVQVQWAMHITGAQRAYVLVLVDRSYYLLQVIERSDRMIADLVELTGEFWDLVLTHTEPPVDGSEATRRALAATAAVPGSRVDLPALWDKVVQERDELHEQIKALKARKDELDNQVRAAAGEHEVIFCQGRKVATYKAPRDREKIDLPELKERHPEAARSLIYTVPQGRRLTYSRSTKTTTVNTTENTTNEDTASE